MHPQLSLVDGMRRMLFPFECIFASPLSTPVKEIAKPQLWLPLEIWLEIFQFATHVPRSTSLKRLDPFTPRRTSNNVMGTNSPALSTRTKLALVLVCKSWSLMTQKFLYEHLVIRSPARASAILQVLLGSRRALPTCEVDIGYGRWPVHIEVFTHSRGTNDIRFLQTLFRIFQCCPNVKNLSGSWMHRLPIEFLDAITKLYGPTLQGLSWDEVNITAEPTTSTPHFLCKFQELRILDLCHFVGCGSKNANPAILTQITLPHLTDLLLSTRQESLQLANYLVLPRLRNLTLCITLHAGHSLKPRIPYNDVRRFLGKHGQSLISVDLPTPAPNLEPEPDSSRSRYAVEHVRPDVFLEPNVCPNLVSLVYPVTSKPLNPQTHPNLERIGLRGISKAEDLYPNKSSNVKTHLEGITPELYPRLREIRAVGYRVNADTDELIKDVFIWWVERFEGFGIDLLDGEGVLWAYADPFDTELEGKLLQT